MGGRERGEEGGRKVEGGEGTTTKRRRRTRRTRRIRMRRIGRWGEGKGGWKGEGEGTTRQQPTKQSIFIIIPSELYTGGCENNITSNGTKL